MSNKYDWLTKVQVKQAYSCIKKIKNKNYNIPRERATPTNKIITANYNYNHN